jgi:hypothetical protein
LLLEVLFAEKMELYMELFTSYKLTIDFLTSRFAVVMSGRGRVKVKPQNRKICLDKLIIKVELLYLMHPPGDAHVRLFLVFLTHF